MIRLQINKGCEFVRLGQSRGSVKAMNIGRYSEFSRNQFANSLTGRISFSETDSNDIFICYDDEGFVEALEMANCIDVLSSQGDIIPLALSAFLDYLDANLYSRYFDYSTVIVRSLGLAVTYEMDLQNNVSSIDAMPVIVTIAVDGYF